MPLDPMTLIMFALIAVLVIFMVRNGKKRRKQMEELQSNMQPGAEVMLQSGIFATIEEVNDEENRITVRSGTTTLVVHRNAIGQVITPVDAPEVTETLAPDDDPAFGERVAGADSTDELPGNTDDNTSTGDEPKA